MPVNVEVVHQLEDERLCQKISQLYAQSPEFSSAEDAIEKLKQALTQDTVLYIAVFNEGIIAAIWSTGQGEQRLLRHVVVHTANRGRGIADRLISEVCRLEEEKGVTTFEPYCGAIRRSLQRLGKLGT